MTDTSDYLSDEEFEQWLKRQEEEHKRKDDETFKSLLQEFNQSGTTQYLPTKEVTKTWQERDREKRQQTVKQLAQQHHLSMAAETQSITRQLAEQKKLLENTEMQALVCKHYAQQLQREITTLQNEAKATATREHRVRVALMLTGAVLGYGLGALFK